MDRSIAKPPGFVRSVGLGLITGAADDDPSAIGTYASAGAKFGLALLWMAPVTFPMMFAVVYLSGKLGQVTGQGLFAVLRKNYSRKVLVPTLVCVLIGNTIEAGADLGGIAAAINLLVPIPIAALVPALGLALLCIQIWGSYKMIRNVFRALALALLAYVPAAILARPDWASVLKATVIPTIRLERDFLAMVVAVIGTTLSAYLYTWQSNEEVEEEKESGRVLLSQRRGATKQELKRSQTDVLIGMFFSNVAMYFIILATATTLFKAGKTDIDSAAQAAQSLAPIAGNAAKVLFALGVIGVGVLAVPVMTCGAAYDLCQTLGWKYGIGKRLGQAKRFYGAIAFFTLIGTALNFLGINPMRALVVAGIVQGFSTPPLMLLIMFMTNNRTIMGDHVNSRGINILGWITTATIFAATIALVVTWIV
ncbi:MAG: Nramp family divalent metal transporter [Bryobacterales bacterium]|nr:Nramp family divalent metal transporter [Bryobacterales bacterium]MBV9398966.1 Nramp family divalent metal transporter [Bryobacterales bacterium]